VIYEASRDETSVLSLMGLYYPLMLSTVKLSRSMVLLYNFVSLSASQLAMMNQFCGCYFVSLLNFDD
jgi:hypothetical protein